MGCMQIIFPFSFTCFFLLNWDFVIICRLLILCTVSQTCCCFFCIYNNNNIDLSHISFLILLILSSYIVPIFHKTESLKKLSLQIPKTEQRRRTKIEERMRSTSVIPFVAMFVVQLGYAGMNITSKLAIQSGMHPLVLVAYRQIFGTLSIAPLAYWLER